MGAMDGEGGSAILSPLSLLVLLQNVSPLPLLRWTLDLGLPNEDAII
jgi:hypothetical protein